MKKLIWALTICTVYAFLANTVSAQDNIIKLRPVGVWVQTLKKIDYTYSSVKRNISNYDLGISYERVLSDKLSAGGDFDFVFAGNAIFIFRPYVNYYLLDSAPNQLYVGGYFDIGGGNIGLQQEIPVGTSYNTITFKYGAHIGLGPKVGYQYLLLDDQLAVMGEFGLGFGMFTSAALDGTGPGAGVNVYFTVGAGYVF